MTTTDEVMELFERANPVPHVDESPVTVPPLSTFDRSPIRPDEPGDGSDRHGGNASRRRWMLAAAAALVAALVAGIVAFGTGEDDDLVPADEPPVDSLPAPDATEPEPEPEPSTESEAEPEASETVAPDPDPDVPTEPVDEPTYLDFAGPDLVGGERYASVFLGVEVEFTLPRDMMLATHRAGTVVMIDGFENGLYTPETGLAVGLSRWAGWSTRAEAVLPEPVASIDPEDIDAWIASNDIVVSGDTTREIAGRPARVLDITVDPLSDVQAAVGFEGGCFPGWEPCFHMGAVASDDEATRVRGDWVSAKRTTRIYLVPIQGSEPLLITVGGPPGSPWFDEIESTFIESLVVGPDRPPLGS